MKAGLQGPLGRYALALAAGGASVLAIRVLEPHLPHGFFYLAAAVVAFVALRFGLGPSLTVSAMCLAAIQRWVLPESSADHLARLALMAALLAGLSVLGSSYERAMGRLRTALASLRESESQLRAAIEGSLDAFYILEAARDATGAVTDFWIRAVNRETSARLGRPREALVGHKMFEVYPTARTSPLYARCFQSLRDGKAFAIDFEVPAGLMEPKWLHVEVVPFGECLAFSSRDITGRMQSELALRRSEESFRSLIETVADPVFVHAEGAIVYVNPSAVRVLGYDTAEQLLGKPLWELAADPEERTWSEAHIRRAYLSAETTHAREARYLKADGSTIWVEVRANPCTFGGKPARVVVARDLTERKAYQSQSALADRLASLGTLVAGTAHELNNPLAYVVSNVQYLQREAGSLGEALPPERAEAIAGALHDVADGARRIEGIVKSLRTFAQPGSGERRVIDPREPLRSALKMVDNQLRQKARVVESLEPVPAVSADAAQLAQIFLNLLVNAMQALPERELERNTVTIATATGSRGEALISVSDTGVGMPPTVLSRIFDPFFTTKPVGHGMGLGLAIAHAIVRSLDGTIQVESRVDQGTRFTVALPPAEQAQVAPPPLAVVAAPEQRLRILLVDDEVNFGRSLALALAPEHELVAVQGGEQALRLLETDAAFDALLCDLMMPGLTGMAFYEKLTHLQPTLAPRTLFMTGGAFTPEAQRFVASLEGRVLEKPFQTERLLAVLQQMLARARAQEPRAGARPAARTG